MEMDSAERYVPNRRQTTKDEDPDSDHEAVENLLRHDVENEGNVSDSAEEDENMIVRSEDKRSEDKRLTAAQKGKQKMV